FQLISVSPNYSLLFPYKSKNDYVIITHGMPSLTAVTVCMWIKTNATGSNEALLSYAVSGMDNELLLFRPIDFGFGVQSVWSSTNVSVNDGKWHHICFAWENTAGSWKLFKDGSLGASGRGFAKGRLIRGGGHLVLGQDQDKLGGDFQEYQSFIGEMADVNIWNHVISDQEVRRMSKSCLTGTGNLFQWGDFKYHRMGSALSWGRRTGERKIFAREKKNRMCKKWHAKEQSLSIAVSLTTMVNRNRPAPSCLPFLVQTKRDVVFEESMCFLLSPMMCREFGYYTHNCNYLCIVKNCFTSFSGLLGCDTKLFTLEKNLFVELREVSKAALTNKKLSNSTVAGYALQFPRKGISDYVIITRGMPNLSAVTVCLWMKTADTRNEGTPLSYVVSGGREELLLYNYRNFRVFINNHHSGSTSVSANDGKWHHICLTWENTAGSWKLFRDGSVAASGQEQDSKGGKFETIQSFIGEMTGVNIWDHVIKDREIARMSKSCLTGVGNVFQWREFKAHIKGSVKIIKPSC
ncbi:unnamed protein product, partial [Pocillopora meandrina]